MPIFQDPDRQRFYDLWSDDRPTGDEQQILESSWVNTQKSSWNSEYPGLDALPSVLRRTSGHDLPVLHANERQELIRYLKRADASALAPTHLPDRRVAGQTDTFGAREDIASMKRKPVQAGYTGAHVHFDASVDLASPVDIERPRSALHSGDFREGSSELQEKGQSRPSLPGYNAGSLSPPLGSSPTTPWNTRSLFPTTLHRQDSPTYRTGNVAATSIRSRTPSFGSFSSSYVLKAPTTPLVYQANNTDLDFSSDPDAVDLSDSPKSSRRRTLPSEFQNSHLSLSLQPDHMNLRLGNTPRRRDSLPHQTYHPRRLLTSAYSLQLASSANAAVPPARRLSFASEKSHAPMVGSYEESLLRGRMSMNPSKPLDFTAQIGVLGKGTCRSNLKCPPHVTIPFPAVFYSYPTSGPGRSISDDNPSPYVGLIDLENSLPKDDSNASRRRRRHRSPISQDNDQMTDDTSSPMSNGADVRRLREKRSRRAESPKCPPGGCYRIPQQGQLQIMIKNPNKTAVKLFLVPYDLGDMEPGSKTFIRQKSYSAGPIIDMPLNAPKNHGASCPEMHNTSENRQCKPTLRYLIHLNICCPSKGRFYLYSGIRVVFANRVPDSQEKLRNEIQQPDPRYTPYKPSRETTIGSKAEPEKALRRRSMGESLYPEFAPLLRSTKPLSTSPPTDAKETPPPESIKENQRMIGKTLLPFQPIPALKESPLSWHPEFLPVSNRGTVDTNPYETGLQYKFHGSDAGYGTSEAGESLSTRRLPVPGLDVHRCNYPSFDFH